MRDLLGGSNIDNELVEKLFKIVAKCDFNKINELLKLSKNEYGVSEEDVLESFCADTENSMKVDGVFSFLKNCVDPDYKQFIENLHSGSRKQKNSLCPMSEETKELLNLSGKKSEHLHCLVQNSIQIVSCIYSEKEVIRLSKNTSQVIDFTMMLVQGSDNECGVVNRIERCIQKALSNCEQLSKVVKFLAELQLKSYECKIDETAVDLSQETTVKALKYEDFMLFIANMKTSFNQCNKDNLMKKLSDLMINLDFPLTGELSTAEKILKTIDLICLNPEAKKELLEFVEGITEDLKKCFDVKYVEYFDKIKELVKRAISDLNCDKLKQDITLLISSYLNIENENNTKFLLKKAIELPGCLFSSQDVKEIVDDSNKLKDFTLRLLSGEDKECKTLDDIQKCVLETFDTSPNSSTLYLITYFSEFRFKFLGCKSIPTTNAIEM
ncbi:unnamed protein product [Diamesa serratosioi]